MIWISLILQSLATISCCMRDPEMNQFLLDTRQAWNFVEFYFWSRHPVLVNNWFDWWWFRLLYLQQSLTQTICFIAVLFYISKYYHLCHANTNSNRTISIKCWTKQHNILLAEEFTSCFLGRLFIHSMLRLMVSSVYPWANMLWSARYRWFALLLATKFYQCRGKRYGCYEARYIINA